VEPVVLVVTATTIVLDGHMPTKNDKENKLKIKVEELIAKNETNEYFIKAKLQDE
jgi:hypothetical protein